MTFSDLPLSAAWRHTDARDGFESVFFRGDRSTGYRIEGHTAAVEGSHVWAVRYVITLDEHWATRAADVWGHSSGGGSAVRLEVAGPGRWRVNGAAAPELDGCVDVDLESSACTNTIPVHRLRLAGGESAQAPAAYLRALDLGVERLDQSYSRLEDHDSHRIFRYCAPGFDFESRLVFDEAGLLLEYPGIALRVA